MSNLVFIGFVFVLLMAGLLRLLQLAGLKNSVLIKNRDANKYSPGAFMVGKDCK
jgi:hypothetical protein